MAGRSSDVLAVGGTTLTVSSSGSYVSETGWGDSGGGISTYETEPTYQTLTGITDKSGDRVAPDVSYDANPSSGFMVYDSVAYDGTSGWEIVGGTSAGAPQWAGIIAIANQARAANKLRALSSTPAYIYAIYSSHPAISTTSPAATTVMHAGKGYDAVTGLGSPVVSSIVRDLATITSSTFSKSSTTITIVASSGSGGSGNPWQPGGGGRPRGGGGGPGSGSNWGGGPGGGAGLGGGHSSGHMTTLVPIQWTDTADTIVTSVETPLENPLPSLASDANVDAITADALGPASLSATDASRGHPTRRSLPRRALEPPKPHPPDTSWTWQVPTSSSPA